MSCIQCGAAFCPDGEVCYACRRKARVGEAMSCLTCAKPGRFNHEGWVPFGWGVDGCNFETSCYGETFSGFDGPMCRGCYDAMEDYFDKAIAGMIEEMRRERRREG